MRVIRTNRQARPTEAPASTEPAPTRKRAPARQTTAYQPVRTRQNASLLGYGLRTCAMPNQLELDGVVGVTAFTSDRFFGHG